MNRRPLLLETLIKRRRTRQGVVYAYRKAMGPRPARDPKIERIFHEAAREFDFGPLMKGDQQQARIVAEDFFKHLRRSAARHGIPTEVVKERLREMSPHLRRGLLYFFTVFDARTKAF